MAAQLGVSHVFGNLQIAFNKNSFPLITFSHPLKYSKRENPENEVEFRRAETEVRFIILRTSLYRGSLNQGSTVNVITH